MVLGFSGAVGGLLTGIGSFWTELLGVICLGISGWNEAIMSNVDLISEKIVESSYFPEGVLLGLKAWTISE